MTDNLFDGVDLSKLFAGVDFSKFNKHKGRIHQKPKQAIRYEWYDIDFELSKNGIEDVTKKQVKAIETIANERPLERGRIVGIWNEGNFGYIRIMFEYNGFVINRNGDIVKVDKPELF